MGYRGEDASRTRTDSRRQPPWQSPSGTGPGATWAGNGESRGHGQHDEYAADDGHGYPPDDSYGGYGGSGYGGSGYEGSGYEGSGYGGYSQGAQYGQPEEHGQRGGYADEGYRDEYGPGPGPGYGEASGHGYGQPGRGGYEAGDGGYRDGHGDYRALPGGPARSDNYPALPNAPAGNYPALPSASPAGSGGYPAQPGGYGASGGYPALPSGRAESGDYPALPGGYAQSGDYDYPAQPSGYAQSGGQHALPGAYGHTGDFPALGTGPDDGQVDLPGRYAGSDWYGQPGTAPGSGFADTGTYAMDARIIDSYGSGPQHAHLTAPVLPGMPYTGQQERYDGESYAGAGYDGQPHLDDQPGYGDDRGYEAPRGYDDYDEPAGFGAGGYAPAAGGEVPDSYDDYADHDDPYQDRYGDGGGAPRFGGQQGKQPKPALNRPGKSGPGKSGSGAGGFGGIRGRRPLLLAGLAVIAVIVLGAAAYTFVLKPKPTASSSTATTGPLPNGNSTTAATAACVKQFGPYCHIELRTEDPAPLTLDEVFPPQFLNETDHNSFARVAAKLDKTCANAVIGQDLVDALQSGKCTQVLRASYVSGDSKIMGTIGVVNLNTTNEAHHAGKVVGANDFIAPLSTSKGIASKLGKGTGVVQAEFKGHYLILTWAEFTSAKTPTTKAPDQQLEAFENDLVAGSANISLSQRMVNGAPASAGG